MPRRAKSTRVVPVETFHTSSKVLDAIHRLVEIHPQAYAMARCAINSCDSRQRRLKREMKRFRDSALLRGRQTDRPRNLLIRRA